VHYTLTDEAREARYEIWVPGWIPGTGKRDFRYYPSVPGIDPLSDLGTDLGPVITIREDPPGTRREPESGNYYALVRLNRYPQPCRVTFDASGLASNHEYDVVLNDRLGGN